MGGGVGGRGSDELPPSSTQPRRRPSLSMLTNESPPRRRSAPDQRWSPEVRRLSQPHEGVSSGQSLAPRVHSGSPDVRRESLLPPVTVSPQPHRRSSREPGARGFSGSVPVYYADRYAGRVRDHPEPAFPERLERTGEGGRGVAEPPWPPYASAPYQRSDRLFAYGGPPPPPTSHGHPPGSSGATALPSLPTSQASGHALQQSHRSPRRAFTYPGVEQSYPPPSAQGAGQRHVRGFVASGASGPVPGGDIGGSRGRYERGHRASLPHPLPSERLAQPRAFFTPLATVHRDFSAWTRDLVDAHRLGWEDAMAAVAEGQFHVDGVVHHRVPLWPTPRRPLSQSRPLTAHDPNLERDLKPDLDLVEREHRERERERELDSLPLSAAKEARLSPTHSLATHPSPYAASAHHPSFPSQHPPPQPHSKPALLPGSGSGTAQDYLSYPPSNAHYQYPYPGHYPPGPYEHPPYGPPPHAAPLAGYGSHTGTYSRVSQQSTPYMRNRQIISCHPCRSRKVKCSGGHPCEACIKIKKTSECEYEKTVRRRGKGKKSLMGETEWQPDSHRDDGGRGEGCSDNDDYEGEQGHSGATTSQATSVASKPSRRRSSERNERSEAAAEEEPEDREDDQGYQQTTRYEQARGTKRSRSDSQTQAGRLVSSQPKRS